MLRSVLYGCQWLHVNLKCLCVANCIAPISHHHVLLLGEGPRALPCGQYNQGAGRPVQAPVSQGLTAGQ